MARGISARIRWILGFLAILIAGIAVFMFWRSNQLEDAYVFANDFSQHTLIENSSEDFILPITVPKNRNFEAVTRPEDIVGQYTSQNVYASELVQDVALIPELPTGQKKFALGLLPVDTRAHPVDIPENIAGTFEPQEMIDIFAIVDEDGMPTEDDTAIVLFQKVRFLEAKDAGEGKVYLVALTNEQIAAYEGWKRSLSVVGFIASITQEANGDYEPLEEIPLYPNYNDPAVKDLFAPPTATPIPTVVPTEAFDDLGEEDTTPEPDGDGGGM